MAEITVLFALLAGVASFFSPCILPLLPAFIAYLAGTTFKDVKRGFNLNIFLHTVFFVIGFSIVFSVVGVLLNGLLGSISFDVKIWLSRIGGLIIIGFGLYLLGLLKIPFLSVAHKITPRKTGNKFLNSFVFGVAFAIGWTPCVGAVLGAIFTLAITAPSQAFNLLFAYSIGLGIPFLLAGVFFSGMSAFIGRIAGFLKYFNIAMGIVLIILGILVITNYIGVISSFSLAEGFLGG